MINSDTTRSADEAIFLKIRLLVVQLQTAPHLEGKAEAARCLGLLRLEAATKEMRQYIVDILSRILDPKGRPSKRELGLEDWTLRLNAAWALGYFGRVTEQTLTAAEPDKGISFAHSTDLWERWLPLPFAQSAVALPALTSPQWFVRLYALYCLSYTLYPLSQAASGVCRIQAVMSDPDKNVRHWATRAVIRTAHEDAIEPLVERLDDSSRHVRRVAAYSLAELSRLTGRHQNGPQLRVAVGKRLLTLLSSDTTSARARVGAVLALGKAKMDGASNALAHLNDHPDENVRRRAVWALGRVT
ncbi:MAG: HEAT repeat domain-containing protein [Janthinobacterium lividum]